MPGTALSLNYISPKDVRQCTNVGGFTLSSLTKSAHHGWRRHLLLLQRTQVQSLYICQAPHNYLQLQFHRVHTSSLYKHLFIHAHNHTQTNTHIYNQISLKKKKKVSRASSWRVRLKAPTVLPGDLGSTPSTQITAHKWLQLQFQDSMGSTCLCRCWVCMWCTDMQEGKINLKLNRTKAK